MENQVRCGTLRAGLGYERNDCAGGTVKPPTDLALDAFEKGLEQKNSELYELIQRLARVNDYLWGSEPACPTPAGEKALNESTRLMKLAMKEEILKNLVFSLRHEVERIEKL